MKKTLILLANGYEEIEALTVVDFLRRADISIDLVSITGKLETVSAHGVHILADKLIEDIQGEEYDAIITPGGIPGATNLAENEKVTSLLQSFYKDNKLVASICASPLALEAAGIAEKVKGTCYPGFEGQIHFKEFSEEAVVKDGNVITSRGPATTSYFALAIIEALAGKETAEKVKNGTLMTFVEEALKA
ncbi:DJ-1 family glyoxalase III [Bacillus benzoevorans]|uniref:4-methyl-5(B-hydroxyethyl)-thiazole monophosphate biosynthesis n=1 Tax=Bacillus benzoevorans TaxID=1456 RepID=A0A7X0HNI0_9BACI|nr:DJ-1 family glyoxalase III [Bacillus benzoevorans]MBB6443964.1 4-methyl-5(b-hydroxyethyl)-thiazole monophosphate biosynthesis [Bacillus benzoevorans]